MSLKFIRISSAFRVNKPTQYLHYTEFGYISKYFYDRDVWKILVLSLSLFFPKRLAHCSDIGCLFLRAAKHNLYWIMVWLCPRLRLRYGTDNSSSSLLCPRNFSLMLRISCITSTASSISLSTASSRLSKSSSLITDLDSTKMLRITKIKNSAVVIL